LADAKVAEGEDDEEELKSPVDPKSGSITDDVDVDVELKQLESFATDVDVVGSDEIDEPL
jgi:hypothetical protein